MKIICLGDSLTEGDYGVKGHRGIANIHKENYPYFLSKNTGWETVNCGKCGYMATNYLEYYKNGSVNVKNADGIVIMLGTNGGHAPNFDTPCNNAYRELISLLRKDAPNAKIILCTPPHATENIEYSNCGYLPQVKDAVEFVNILSKEEKLPLIDVYNCGYFTSETESTMQPNDGLHFGEEGYKVLAQVIEKGIKEIL